MFHRLINAQYLSVGLGMNQAGKSVTRVAANAAALVRMLFIEHHPERNMEGLEPGGFESSASCLIRGSWLIAGQG